MSDDPLRALAEKRADAKLGFRSHLISYGVVISGLVALNLATTPHNLWCLWAAGGWGLGLIAHGLSVHVGSPCDREKAVARELNRLKAARRLSV